MTESVFIVELHYTAPLVELDTYLIAHRAYLDDSYNKGIFIASGPQHPRTGGIIIAKGATREQLADIMDADPFMINKVATYKVIEFNPVKFSDDFRRAMMPAVNPGKPGD